MKFKVCSSARCYFEMDRLVEDHPSLKDFDFELVDVQYPVRTAIRDETGRLISQTTTRTETRAYITIDTLERLLELENAVGHALIITSDEIEIYDTYRE